MLVCVCVCVFVCCRVFPFNAGARPTPSAGGVGGGIQSDLLGLGYTAGDLPSDSAGLRVVVVCAFGAVRRRSRYGM